MCRTSYSPAYDQISFPYGYKVPWLVKFSGQDETSTMEHINRFIVQRREVANQVALRVRLFSLSLSGSAFAWFTSLPANSILYWTDLEKNSFINTSIMGFMRWSLRILLTSGRGMMKQWLRSYKDSGKWRTDASVWCYPNSNRPKWLFMVSYHVSQKFESIGQIAHRTWWRR